MVSIIVTWRDRSELKQSLPSLVEAARALNGNVILVNFGGSGKMLSEIIQGFENDLCIASVDDQAYFNKSCAQNIGASCSTNPVLFFCDCDIILEPQIIKKIVTDILANEKTFVTLEKVFETEKSLVPNGNIISEGYELYLRTANGRELKIFHRSKDLENGVRMAPGLILVKRNDFLSIKGYNSNFEGWGWESQDIIARLVLGVGLTRIITGEAIHISHDEFSRVAHARNPDRFENRDKMYREALANYDVSFFDGSYDSDIRLVQSAFTNGFFKPLTS